VNAPVDPVYARRSVETEEMRALRKRIDRARSACLHRVERASSWDAGTFMLRGAQIASTWVWALATPSQLEDVLLVVTGLFMAANAAERLEAPDD
jgi:hypothetical protein